MTRNTIIALIIFVLLGVVLIVAPIVTEEPSGGDAQSLGAQ